MCLAVPGQIKEIYGTMGMRMGKVSFGGIIKEVCLAYLPDIAVGDYTIVHVGFAITKIELSTEGEVLGLDAAGFQKIAEEAKKGCPVSKALAAVPEITLNAKLL